MASVATTAVDAPHAEFGKYHLLRKLAQGGMAEIFLANQKGIKGFEKLVVLKRVLPDLSASDDFVEMFLDEARIAARLEHPNIVRIHDLGEVNNQYFIAMEYIAGEDQASVIQQAKRLKTQIPIEYAVDVIIGAAEALHFAHDTEDAQGNPLNLVHRDVSPSNIIFTWQGSAKLVDFGIARAESNVAKTSGGQVKGKIQYLSPEQCRGERADKRSDLFAVGIVLYELLTRKRLFQRDTPLATMNAILKSEVPQLQTVRPGVPAELESIMRKALMTDPEMRYQNGAELAADLSVWLAGTGYQRGAKSVDFLTKLFGEERKKAKLRVARGQHLDEAGYKALDSLPTEPGARPHSKTDARPGSSVAATRPPTSPSGQYTRPPTSPSGTHPRPPSQPSGLIRTPAPPSISPVERPSYPNLPQLGTPSRPAMAQPLAAAANAGAAPPRDPLELLADEDDSELMRTVAAGDVAEMLAKSAQARGRAGAGLPSVPRPSAPPAPVVPPPPAPRALTGQSQPRLQPISDAPRGLTGQSQSRLQPISDAPARPLAPPSRPSQPNLQALANAALDRPPTRPSQPSLGAAAAALTGEPPARQQPTAFDPMSLPAPEVSNAAFSGDLDAARAALFGEVRHREGAIAPKAEPAPEPVAAPPRPRPSRDLTEAAAELAARIKASSSSPNLQPVAETKPYAPPKRMPMTLVIGGAIALLALSLAGYFAFGRGEEKAPPPPAPAPAPVVVAPPPPTPAETLGVGGIRFTGVPSGAKVTVDGNVIGDPSGENFFPKGMHNVVVEAKGFGRFERTVDLTAGSVTDVKVELKKAGPVKKK
jgi:eukaryotic-like serine/threonine-protein kinase